METRTLPRAVHRPLLLLRRSVIGLPRRIGGGGRIGRDLPFFDGRRRRLPRLGLVPLPGRGRLRLKESHGSRPKSIKTLKSHRNRGRETQIRTEYWGKSGGKIAPSCAWRWTGTRGRGKKGGASRTPSSALSRPSSLPSSSYSKADLSFLLFLLEEKGVGGGKREGRGGEGKGREGEMERSPGSWSYGFVFIAKDTSPY